MRKPSCKGYLSSAKSFYEHATYTRTTPIFRTWSSRRFTEKEPPCGFCVYGPRAPPQGEAREDAPAPVNHACRGPSTQTWGGMAGGSEGCESVGGHDDRDPEGESTDRDFLLPLVSLPQQNWTWEVHQLLRTVSEGTVTNINDTKARHFGARLQYQPFRD